MLQLIIVDLKQLDDEPYTILLDVKNVILDQIRNQIPPQLGCNL